MRWPAGPRWLIRRHNCALTLYREVGDRYYEPDPLIKLGETHRATGDLDAARDAWEDALAILDDIGRPEADAVRADLATLGSTRQPESID
ncbi:hypothetical protein [Winogradskya humida]|uniref:Tetratricopeptide repeat protein n=1 Tax=Winogradskya humida TaxID=113566 RepID=A0ABQ4A2S7_9ACTN|nr:hypothetical protein [Actinoplanes humidus]GIE25143.1 hypothetical protein Ahu01nite_082450 [Actinoplanes humidus]